MPADQPKRSPSGLKIEIGLLLIRCLSIIPLTILNLESMVFIIRNNPARLRALQRYVQDWTKRLKRPSAEVKLTYPDQLLAAMQPQDEIGDLARAFEQLLKLLVASQSQITRLYEESYNQEALLTATFQSVADGIVIYNNQGEVVNSNAAANQLVGQVFKPGEAVEAWVKSRLLYRMNGQALN